MLLLFSQLLHSAIFPGYDFTFFETVSSDSLSSKEEDNVGLDYTGYGFIGGEMRTGIYMRLGFQAPYSSLIAMFTDFHQDTEEDIQENLEKSFRFSGSAGPAFRKLISEDAIWYMGLGASYGLDYKDRQISPTGTRTTLFDMDFGFDFDIGVRLDATKTTTVRIGVHGAFTFFTVHLQVDTPRDGNGESSTTAYMTPNMFLPAGSRERLQAEGYISLGHTFRQHGYEKKMRYVISSPALFTGELEEVNQELPSLS